MTYPPYTPHLKLGEIQHAAISLVNNSYESAETWQLVKILLGFYTGYPPYKLLAMADSQLSVETYEHISTAVRQLAAGVPIQYIIGETDFYGLKLAVGTGVLIPRPETEELVAWIVADNKTHLSPAILDLGTGSGAIALSLKSALPAATVSGIDISEVALIIARKNAARTNLDVEFIRFDLLQENDFSEPGKFDIIVSNPPYILESEASKMHINVLDYEPHLALFVPDADAMKFYRPVARLAFKFLNPGGLLYLEINEAFAQLSSETVKAAGFENVEFKSDLQGKTRMLRAGKPGI